MVQIYSYIKPLNTSALDLFCAKIKSFSYAAAFYEKDKHPFEALFSQIEGTNNLLEIRAYESRGTNTQRAVNPRRAFGLGMCIKASRADTWKFNYHHEADVQPFSKGAKVCNAGSVLVGFVPQAFLYQAFNSEEEAGVVVPTYVLWEHAGVCYVALNSTQKLQGSEVESLLEELCKTSSKEALPYNRANNQKGYKTKEGCNLEQEIKTQGKEAYLSLVERAKQSLEQGLQQKIVCARKVTLNCGSSPDPEALIKTLVSRETPGTLIVRKQDSSLWYALSPELLVDQSGNTLRTMALAGTYCANARREQGMQLDSKTREEHMLVVEDIRSKLQPFVEKESLKQSGKPLAMNLGTLRHACTPLTAISNSLTEETAGQGQLFQRVCQALHPTAALGGYPSKEALEFLHLNEGFNRALFGGYCALLGCGLGAEESCSMNRANVVLRCFCTEGSLVSFYAGCGIVKASDALEELEESSAKMWSVARLVEDCIVEEC